MSGEHTISTEKDESDQMSAVILSSRASRSTAVPFCDNEP